MVTCRGRIWDRDCIQSWPAAKTGEPLTLPGNHDHRQGDIDVIVQTKGFVAKVPIFLSLSLLSVALTLNSWNSLFVISASAQLGLSGSKRLCSPISTPTSRAKPCVNTIIRKHTLGYAFFLPRKRIVKHTLESVLQFFCFHCKIQKKKHFSKPSTFSGSKGVLMNFPCCDLIYCDLDIFYHTCWPPFPDCQMHQSSSVLKWPKCSF